MINRILSSSLRKSKKSVLLLGPRQVGKSTLIKEMNCDLTVNFADESVYLRHSQNFDLLRSLIERNQAKKIFIDEVQRLPQILNTIQALIDEDTKLQFFLTGSSARKLKKGGANLLPGRVINHSLGPLIFKEVGYQVASDCLAYGYLPGIYTETDIRTKKGVLKSYGANYIHEEIKAEALVKDLPSFARFLDLVPETVGRFVDYTKLAQRSKVSRHQIPRYFEIFEDTMLGSRVFPDPQLLESFDLVKHPKFYFFDVGVYNGLMNSFSLAPERLGAICEQVVFQQLYHSARAIDQDLEISSFRTRGGLEVDFLVTLNSRKIAIEVKSTDNLIEDDVRHLARLKNDNQRMDFYLVHFGKHEIKLSGVWCLPFAKVLRQLGL